jgi:uncharacterized protein YndB with AHSA1/START domain
VTGELAAAVVRRVLPAPPHVVFDEWLDADGLLEWMCPRPARVTRVELEPEVGGRLLIDMADEGLVQQVRGTYLELDRPRRLSFTWKPSIWDDSARDSVVTVTFEPHGDGQTLMTIRHVLLRPDLGEAYEQGWAGVASQLGDRLATRSS